MTLLSPEPGLVETTQEPGLFSEGWLFASLLEMLVEHCGTGDEGAVKSFGWGANARAMQLLAEAGYLEISAAGNDDEIEGRVSTSDRDLLAQAQRAAGRPEQQIPKRSDEEL